MVRAWTSCKSSPAGSEARARRWRGWRRLGATGSTSPMRSTSFPSSRRAPALRSSLRTWAATSTSTRAQNVLGRRSHSTRWSTSRAGQHPSARSLTVLPASWTREHLTAVDPVPDHVRRGRCALQRVLESTPCPPRAQCRISLLALGGGVGQAGDEHGRAGRRAHVVGPATIASVLGNAFLVAPLRRARATLRSVPLPARSRWYDWWTGTLSHEGEVHAERRLLRQARAKIPLYVKEGAVSSRLNVDDPGRHARSLWQRWREGRADGAGNDRPRPNTPLRSARTTTRRRRSTYATARWCRSPRAPW